MDPGKLNRLVQIQQLADAEDAAGQPSTAWVDYGVPVWANIRYLTGVESIKAGAESARTRASIRIRYRTDITSAMRVVHGGVVYEIKVPLPDEENRQYLDLQCEVVQ